MLNSILNSYKRFLITVKDIFSRHFSTKKRNKRKFRKVLNKLSLEDRFTQIYKINYWNSKESISGIGSTLKATEKLREKLPLIFNEFSINKVFDGPCGDFNWMKEIIEKTNIEYCGGDIVLPLIKQNQSNYSNKRIKFIHIDLTKEIPPSADLMICRDCLFHLSFNDTKHVLNNYIASNTPFLLTTTYENASKFENKDILTGHFRKIDLFSSPYNFPKNTLFQTDDWVDSDSPRYMCLWSRDQIIEAMKNFT